MKANVDIAAVREVATLVEQGHAAVSIAVSIGFVTIVCTNEVSAARWRERTPNGLLPESRVPVQVVVLLDAAREAVWSS